MSRQRVLPADVYDTLELSAYAWDGIGGGPFMWTADCPQCVYGHAATAADIDGLFHGPISDALEAVLLAPADNERAVARINRRKGSSETERVSWKEYSRELNIVRGD